MTHERISSLVARDRAARRAFGALSLVGVLAQLAAPAFAGTGLEASATTPDTLATPAMASSPSAAPTPPAERPQSGLSPKRRMGRYRHYASCLGLEEVRLRGRHGFKVVAQFTEPRADGIYYVLAASDSAASARAGLLRWEDVRAVEMWDTRKLVAFRDGSDIGIFVGLLLTTALGTLPRGRAPSLGGGLAIVGVTGLIGGLHATLKPGRWIYCEERGQ